MKRILMLIAALRLAQKRAEPIGLKDPYEPKKEDDND